MICLILGRNLRPRHSYEKHMYLRTPGKQQRKYYILVMKFTIENVKCVN